MFWIFCVSDILTFPSPRFCVVLLLLQEDLWVSWRPSALWGLAVAARSLCSGPTVISWQHRAWCHRSWIKCNERTWETFQTESKYAETKWVKSSAKCLLEVWKIYLKYILDHNSSCSHTYIYYVTWYSIPVHGGLCQKWWGVFSATGPECLIRPVSVLTGWKLHQKGDKLLHSPDVFFFTLLMCIFNTYILFYIRKKIWILLWVWLSCCI